MSLQMFGPVDLVRTIHASGVALILIPYVLIVLLVFSGVLVISNCPLSQSLGWEMVIIYNLSNLGGCHVRPIGIASQTLPIVLLMGRYIRQILSVPALSIGDNRSRISCSFAQDVCVMPKSYG